MIPKVQISFPCFHWVNHTRHLGGSHGTTGDFGNSQTTFITFSKMILWKPESFQSRCLKDKVK